MEELWSELGGPLVDLSPGAFKVGGEVMVVRPEDVDTLESKVRTAPPK